MADDRIKTLLLLALPASGKSELRRYLAHLSPDKVADDFRLDTTVQIDDFPYVHLMRRIDETLEQRGENRLYFQAEDRPLIDPRHWGTLIQLLNDDYRDIVARRKFDGGSAAEVLFGRIDAAAEKVGAQGRIAELDAEVRAAVADAIEAEARSHLDDKVAGYPDRLEGKTLVIEFARGGPDGADRPLPAPLGYRYSVAQLAPEILEHAKILYVWVTPEESRRKNQARTDPDDPGSILHHGVPLTVMMEDYGCDDMDWLEENARQPGTIPIDAHGKAYDLPLARFDNRVDKTSFIREEPSDWADADVQALHSGLKAAFDKLAGS